MRNYNKWVYFLFLFFIICLGCSSRNYENKKIIRDTYVDTRFLITNDSSIVFTLNESEQFKLIRYKENSSHELFPSGKDFFYPHKIGNKIGALYDYNSNEKFQPVLEDLQNYTQSIPIKFIQSSSDGRYLIYLLNNDSNIYLINIELKDKSVIDRIEKKFHSAVFSKDGMFLILSYDEKLVYYSPGKNSKKEIAKNLKGEKLNPDIYENDLFFVSNYESEFYQIYKINMENGEVGIKAVHKSEHDLRLPRNNGDYLYYIEIVNSEYLLKRKRLNDNNIELITNKGVVYNYEFFLEDKLVFIYSDFCLPKSIIIYDLNTAGFNNITTKPLEISSSYSYLTVPNLSDAYILKPKSKMFKGVILYIHPGFNDNFSPRWDPLLNNLLEQEYLIIAPNYPMSGGFGKTFSNMNFNDAVKDIIAWKNYLRENYKNKSLFMLSSSSGNILMECCLNIDKKGIKAAASFFGIPYNISPDFTTPTLFFLGENDPKVNSSSREKTLSILKEKGFPFQIKCYSDEGHWFRKSKNLENALNITIDFFE